MQAVSMYAHVQEGLGRVEEKLKGLHESRFPFLAELLDHVLDSHGKRIRPAITLLAGTFFPHDRKITEIMATAVELLHLATLIHDDTVDNSDTRRGKATVSSLWGRNVAVLLGDYIFATSATYVCDTGNVAVIRRFSETIMELSSGELQELVEAYNWRQTREQYLKRIYNKTASLFTTAGASGAILSGATQDIVDALRDYSYNLGMAFQIVDDILDLDGTSEEVGKPVGNDLAQGVMTLPAIMVIERHPENNPVISLFQEPGNTDNLERAVKMIQSSTIIGDAYTVAKGYCGRALKSLSKVPDTPSRDSLEELVGYVLDRRQ